jgi:Domain of unknown function (DUF4168)
MPDLLRSRFSFPRFFPRMIGLLIVALAMIAEAPMLNQNSSGLLGQAAWAETPIPDSWVSYYAKAVLEIEPIRRRYFQKAQQVISGKFPSNLCYGNYQSNIPPGLERICDRYLRESNLIIQKHNLTWEQFNAITVRANHDPALKDRIQRELLRYQKP